MLYFTRWCERIEANACLKNYMRFVWIIFEHEVFLDEVKNFKTSQEAYASDTAGECKVEFSFDVKNLPEKDEDKKKVFFPNFTTKSSGMGVGLSVSQDIVQRMGGSITFESEVGKGTVFTIDIPILK